MKETEKTNKEKSADQLSPTRKNLLSQVNLLDFTPAHSIIIVFISHYVLFIYGNLLGEK